MDITYFRILMDIQTVFQFLIVNIGTMIFARNVYVTIIRDAEHLFIDLLVI